MVTNPVENGMVKCHEYWPTRGISQYGGMVVTLVGEKLFPEFIERKFTLTVASKNKKVACRVGQLFNIRMDLLG